MPEAGTELFEELMRFKPDGLTPNGWVVKAGIGRTFWSDLRRHGNPSRRTLEKLLGSAGSSLAEFEALRVGRAPSAGARQGRQGQLAETGGLAWRAAPLPPVPLLETRLLGEWGEAGSGIELAELNLDGRHGEVARPASLAADREAYALTVLSDAMWPRFRPGRQLLISPAAAASIGDDVALQMAGPSTGQNWVPLMVKELVRRTPAFVELRQFNPDKTFRVDGADVRALHKVVGEAY
jgi:hypothetical protein